MTGAEIIKGLECCNRADNAVCDDCPYNEYNRVDAHYPYSCQRYLRMDALALIKRQKADSEKLHEIIANGIVETPFNDVFGMDLPISMVKQLWYAVYALCDMVLQFGYTTTFRKKDALFDGGLSALETAFAALVLVGCPINSNGTISVEKLMSYMDKIDTEEQE